MKPWLWLRVAAGLQAFGTFGHTMAIARTNATRGPGEQAVFDAMRSFQFSMTGVNRSHWDIYRGYELYVSVIFAVLAVLIWQVSNLSRTNPRSARPILNTLLACEVLLDVLNWIYFSPVPGTVGGLIVLCMAAAAFALREDSTAAATAQVRATV